MEADLVIEKTENSYRRGTLRAAAKWIGAIASTHSCIEAESVFAQKWPRSLHADAIRETVKVAIGAGLNGQLMPGVLGEAVIAASRQYEALARIPGALRIPFFTSVNLIPDDASCSWVQSGLPAPAMAYDFDEAVRLTPLHLAIIAIFTQEFMRFERGDGSDAMTREIARAIGGCVDTQAFDPTLDEIADTRPKSLTFGAAAIASGGSSAADIREDLRRLFAVYVGLGGRVESAVFALGSRVAVAMRLSDPEAYPQLNRDGGSIAGIPAVCSEAIGNQIVLLDTVGLHISEGGLDVSASSQAAVEMRTDPTQNGLTGTGASLVSLFQNDLAGVRLVRTINYKLTTPIARISNVLYHMAGSPS